ncbi:hybrid sensor histidine kinase/response regulator transcription factor [Gaetbulibacter saemankumensis]|uniref:hybrid sensor histidine kinase/response regulator transcription factor n=1 Tax=Gaetbulibacter saemankumensis TaxID=311208 RepID=UPI00048645B4|nr:hybrid sensor histidine kinase/response regulator transcription factor [Gaetbulibacter saemankumensis]
MKVKKCYISFFLLLFICAFGKAQNSTNFETIDTPFKFPIDIASDHLGYLWITDIDGIYKFIGHDYLFIPHKEIFGEDFVVDRDFTLKRDYSSNLWITSENGELTKIDSLGNYSSFKNNVSYNKKPIKIKALEPSENSMWFGSDNGTLLKYDNLKATIDSISTLPEVEGKTQYIKSLVFTTPSNMYLTTLKGKIWHYDVKQNIFSRISLFPENYNLPVSLDKDINGNLWLATEDQGLIYYNPESKETKQFGKIQKSQNQEKYAYFISVFCDSNGVVWAGTDGDGLYSINTKTSEVQIYKHQYYNKYSISNNTIINIIEDLKGNLWFISKKGIINVLPKRTNNIKHYTGLDNNRQALILSILKSSKGDLWLGTDEHGLTRIKDKNKVVRYYKDKKGDNYFEGEYIQCLEEDSKGNIWIGTYKNGVWVFNIENNTFKKVNVPINTSNDVRDLLIDSKNRIWVLFSETICVLSERGEFLANLNPSPNGYIEDTDNNICQDSHGALWLNIGKDKLYRFDENLNDITLSNFEEIAYFNKEAADNSFNYSIRTMTIDHDDNLWLITFSGFVIKYSIKENLYTSYLNSPQFKNYYIISIIEDDNNDLWLGTSNNGLIHYQKENHLIKSYYSHDGLNIKQFRSKSTFKDKDGMLYFGGEEGVNAFYPDKLVKQKNNAKLYINDISILNKPARHILKDQIHGHIEHIKNLTFKANQSSFSIKFSAIDNVLNSNYFYAYKLKGFDEDWIVPGKDISAHYTNIPAGNYTFQVKAGTKPNAWDIAPIELGIKIKPYWWNTIPAYIAYLFIITFLVYSYVIRKRLKNELLKEAWQNEQAKELYAMKMNFFAKMSHEIQTPLTLILGPINDMLARASANGNGLLKQRLTMINNNANRLSRLAMELMTLRNKELGKLRLYASKNNLIEHLKNITISFSEQARFKKIDFVEHYPSKDIFVWYDKDKIEHVIYNLLSNAFKFTPNNGRIEVKVEVKKKIEQINISVKDSGPGIPKEDLDDIFELFYQSDLGKQVKGTGIGLALTKELIDLHKGKIKVNSCPEKGTSFIISLHSKEHLFAEDEKIYLEKTETESTSLEADFKALEDELKSINKNKQVKRHTLVIVEDNVEMQIFLKDVLSNSYNLFIAKNGEEGIKIIEKHSPDLIISDIMMPVMNGLDMCKILQKKKSTAHIPIILLTAKNTDTTRLKGLKYGAIEYIQKPFNFSELLLKINNIITTKERAISKYKTDKISTPEEISEPSRDDVFMNNLVKELNEHIVDPNFKLDDLSKSLGMSYSVIYRKCQDITGKTLVEFLRSFRIKKGAVLIIEQGYNISEAAFMVGYKDSKYFTKCFKEEFGIPPSTLKRDAKNLGIDVLIKKYKLKL